MRPIDVATAETLGFVRRALPAPPLRVLEVGCGPGDLAARLLADGVDVTALDASADAVRAARAAGVPAVHADFLAYHDEPYDALLFTRSLHHMRSLPDAVARSLSLLRPGGWLVVDEFVRERADRQTAAWLYDTRALLLAAGVARGSPEVDAPARDPLERWRAEHRGDPGHPRHDAVAMRTEIARRFEIVEAQDVPYLYRALIRLIEDTARGYDVACRLLEIERRGIAAGRLVPTGVRWVARVGASPKTVDG
ncbi:MAG TPA: methyltransferase domain-containing protein [bacterium]|nr:methyltransferase domain-containing protein [bacterium]